MYLVELVRDGNYEGDIHFEPKQAARIAINLLMKVSDKSWTQAYEFEQDDKDPDRTILERWTSGRFKINLWYV